MSNAQQLEQLEITIEEATEAVALRDSLRKLAKNRDFKKIIDEGYFKNEAVRLVAAKASPYMQGLDPFGVDKQIGIDKSISAIGELQQYFNAILITGTEMERSITASEETREEILAEDLEDEVGE